MSMKGLETQNWLDFSGNIFGSLLGVLGAYSILRYQLKVDEKKSEKNQIDNTIFNLIDMFQKVRDKLDIDGKKGVFSDIFLNIETEKENYIKKLKKHDLQVIFNEENKKIIEDVVKDVRNYMESIKDESNELDIYAVKNLLKGLMLYKEKQYAQSFIIDIDYLIELEEDLWKLGIKNKITKLNEIKSEAQDFIIKYKNYTFGEKDDEEVHVIVNNIYIKNQLKIGNYLRIFYRALKYINESNLSLEEKKAYRGILRALLTSEEILVIFYNTFYTERGKKMLEKMLDSDSRRNASNPTGFFADINDLKNFDSENKMPKVDLPFFKYSELYFNKLDLKKVYEVAGIEMEKNETD